MSSDRNNETQESLKREFKAIQAMCVNACQIIENAPPEAETAVSEGITTMRINNYIEGLRTEVLNSNTPFSTDDNLLTSQFLIEMRNKTQQLEEMVAFTKGNIHDMNAEINRIQTLIDISKEAQLKPQTIKAEVKPEHINKAKEKFQKMKDMLHSLIQSLFPDSHASTMEVLSSLMSAKLEYSPNGYIPITDVNYVQIQMLKDMNIVTPNPYNHSEVKLTYY